MDRPLVSIVLPTYNGSRFLRKSVESCLQQTYSNIELILVDDCSTDDTGNMADEFKRSDSRVKVIHNKTNQKLPTSLNIGFGEASGKYFTWTSDDNYYAPNAIETLVKVLEENVQTDLVYADYYEIDDEGKVIGIKKFGDINKSLLKWLGCGACFLYKAEVHFRNKGYNAATFLIEDYDFFLRASLHSKFFYLPVHELYYYRHHESSLTGTLAPAVFDIQKYVMEKHIPALLSHLSKRDTMLLYRKYAVYYAVYKNHSQKTNYYLAKLYSISAGQAFLTVGFIIFRKFITGISMSMNVFFTFFKLIFKPSQSS